MTILVPPQGATAAGTPANTPVEKTAEKPAEKKTSVSIMADRSAKVTTTSPEGKEIEFTVPADAVKEIRNTDITIPTAVKNDIKINEVILNGIGNLKSTHYNTPNTTFHRFIPSDSNSQECLYQENLKQIYDSVALDTKEKLYDTKELAKVISDLKNSDYKKTWTTAGSADKLLGKILEKCNSGEIKNAPQLLITLDQMNQHFKENLHWSVSPKPVAGNDLMSYITADGPVAHAVGSTLAGGAGGAAGGFVVGTAVGVVALEPPPFALLGTALGGLGGLAGGATKGVYDVKFAASRETQEGLFNFLKNKSKEAVNQP